MNFQKKGKNKFATAENLVIGNGFVLKVPVQVIF